MFYLYRCDGKSKCVVSVDSMSFHDACPGTLKYLEIHYACHSRSHKEIPSDSRKPLTTTLLYILVKTLLDQKASHQDSSQDHPLSC